MRIQSVVVLLVGLLVSAGCASQQCDFHSQCGDKHYCARGRCWQDCQMDFDCDDGLVCNAIGRCVVPSGQHDAGPMDAGMMMPPVPDAGPMPMPDSGPPPPPDSGPPPIPDSGPPPIPDSGPPPARGRYLDRCSTDADCESGRCVDDVGGSRMCTITCSSHNQCASGHVCANGICRRDDTGSHCTGSAGCVLGLCIPFRDEQWGECSRPCSNASDCPAGYACAPAANNQRLCVNIERPCEACVSDACLASDQGCTASCRTYADCPVTPPELAYECVPDGVSGAHYCVPSGAVYGSDPIGATVRLGYDGNSLCRSGISIKLDPDDEHSLEICTQICTERGGCGPGFACVPAGTTLICLPAGISALGTPCTQDNQCASGLCHPDGYCTRLCSDGLCPSDMTCVRQPALDLSACVR